MRPDGGGCGWRAAESGRCRPRRTAPVNPARTAAAFQRARQRVQSTEQSEASRIVSPALILRRHPREATVARVFLTGNAQNVTDAVKRASEILKDRDLPKPKADTRRNFTPSRPKPKAPPADSE